MGGTGCRAARSGARGRGHGDGGTGTLRRAGRGHDLGAIPREREGVTVLAMSEEQLSGGGVDSATGPVCPWCSAALPSDREENCPSCGAALHEAASSEVPGVTRIDHEALLKGRPTTQKSRGLIGWLSGEYEAEAEATPAAVLEPPDEAVRREMLRLELAALEAEVLARQAEVVAEVAAETGEPVDLDDLRLDTVSEASVDDTEAPGGDGAAGPDPDAGNEGGDNSAADADADEESSGA